MIMNLQLFASGYNATVEGDDLINTGIYFIDGRTYENVLNMHTTDSYNVTAFLKDGWGYDNFTVTGIGGTVEVEYDEDEGEVHLLIKNPTQKGRIILHSSLNVGNFHVTEPVTITINNEKTELLATLQPTYAANGAFAGTIARDPYQLRINDAVKALIRRGVLVEAPDTDR